jgi:aminoglycoside phosphotransferase (APT) family kinase protein
VRQLDDYERFLAWALDGATHPTCEHALEWLRRNRPRGQEPRAVCWGDARIGNMVFQDSRCAAVLDWEMATIASPEQDLAWWLFLDHHHSAGLGSPRLTGFPERGETIARWEEWTGREARHLAYYEVFAAFRFSVIMVRVARQMEFQGVLPAGSGFERDNIPSRLLAAMLDLPPPGGVR